jgi:succinoglycan biosynthesis transport protein ExoP
MSQLPVHRGPEDPLLPAQFELAAQLREEHSASELWGILRRNWWLVLASVLLCGGAGIFVAMRSTPIYQSSTSIRIDEKQSAIPELLPLATGSEVSTEMEVLSSRTLAEDAVSRLALQFRLIEPIKEDRSALFGGIQIAPDAESDDYVLTREPGGQFAITLEEDGGEVGRVTIGKRVRFRGVSFLLLPEAARHERIVIGVSRFSDAVARVRAGIRVSRTGRDVKIVTLTYQSRDRELTAEVPNLIAERFVARRDAAQRAAAGSTIAFLQQQLDTLASQLRSAEAALLAYRERERVVNPAVEGSSQLNRIVQLQTERSMLESERSSLHKLVQEVQAKAATAAPDRPSAYRNLLAFPSLLRNQAASELLRSLTAAEDERSALLGRRTLQDPDVKVLSARIESIEGELQTMAASYLQGLTHQVASLDSTLGGFGRELQRVPERELQYTRLERQPKLLEELFSLLQTRLKEAQISQAATDLSVQVVDPAERPRRPIHPRPMLNLFLGVMLGALVGTGAGFVRELLDKAVHTRADVLLATGVSVIGLIPRIPRNKSRFALISEKRPPRRTGEVSAPSSAPPGPPVHTPHANGRMRYTFLGTAEQETSEEPVSSNGTAPAPPPAVAPAVSRAGIRRMAISEPGMAATEAYGGLLTNLSFALADSPPRLIAFTSALPGEGKTTNAVNLALALAHRGAKVLLVDGDLRRGVVHNVFEGQRDPGLTNVLWGQMSFDAARRTVEVGDTAVLDYLTTGTLPPNPTSLVESNTMRLLLEQWRERYDSVVIDTPPVNVITDAALLGAHSDGVVLVARSGVTHAAALTYALEQLRRVKAKVLGVVLSDIDFARDAVYDPTYRYHRYDQYTTAKS